MSGRKSEGMVIERRFIFRRKDGIAIIGSHFTEKVSIDIVC